jgi:plasmid stabilization system protein ParE
MMSAPSVLTSCESVGGPERNHVAGDTVKAPRHFVLYRFAGKAVEFARLLHDSRDLAQHLPEEYQTGE